MANRTKCTPIKKKLILEGMVSGLSLTAAAARADVARRTVYDWRDADADFARDLADAFALGTDRLADLALRRALQPGNVHDAMLIFILKSRDPERFNRKMLPPRIVGDPNNPVTVQQQFAGQAQPGVKLVIVPGDDTGDTEAAD
jgi:hypothetical protein